MPCCSRHRLELWDYSGREASHPSLPETITSKKFRDEANRGNSQPLARIRKQRVSQEIPWCPGYPDAGCRHVRRDERSGEERRGERGRGRDTGEQRAIVSHQGETGCEFRNSMVRDRGFLCIYLAYRDAPGNAALIVRIYWPVPGDVLHFKPRRSTLSDFAGFQCNTASVAGLAERWERVGARARNVESR